MTTGKFKRIAERMYKSPPRNIRQVFDSLPEGTWCQVVNGRLIMSPSYTVQHQSTAGDVLMALHDFVKTQKLGKIIMGPIDSYLDDQNFFQPDILFVSNERMHIIQDHIYGAPDLVVEILLPESAELDKVEKKAVYERCGVKEYWLVDPETKEVTGCSLQGNVYVEIPLQSGLLVSPLLGCLFLKPFME